MSLIVIYDDHSTKRGLYARLASALGPNVEVKSFAQAEAALTFLATAAVDLVVVACSGGEMTGAHFVHMFRQTPQLVETPVIVINAEGERSQKLSALEAGAADVLAPPIDPDEFITRSRNALAGRRRLAALVEKAETLAEEATVLSERCQSIERRSHDLLNQVIDGAPILISAVDPHGKILFANAAQGRFFGVTREAAEGAALAQYVGLESAERNAALDRLIYETGAALPAYEETLISLLKNSLFQGTGHSALAMMRIAGSRSMAVITNAMTMIAE